MANKETSGYNQSKTPVSDPTHIFTGVTAATDSATPSTLTYTTATKHNFVIGQSVIIYGFSVSGYNFSPELTVNGVSTALGAGRPAVVASVATDKLSFTVKLTSQFTTASTGTGYILNTADESNSPWDTAWLPSATDAATAANYQVGLEWGDSFPIQPNDGRNTAAGASSKTTASVSGAVASGSVITYTTNASHGLAAGQWISIDGIVPAQFNFNLVQVASVVDSTNFTVVSTVTGTFDSTNSFGQVAPVVGNGGAVQAIVATTAATVGAGTAGPRAVAVTAAVGNGTKFTYTIPSGHGIVVGQPVTLSGLIPTAYNITGVVGTAGATSIEIANTTSNPGALTKSGVASVQANTYKTVTAHGLTAGQNTIVSGAVTSAGASIPELNVSGTVTSTASSTLFSVNAKKYAVNAATTAPIVVSGTAVQYVLQGGHSTTTSDSVSVYGFIGGANLNTYGDVAVSAVSTNSITINTPAAVAAAGITGISAGGGTTITYTANNTFKPGQIVTIAGLANGSATSFNVKSVIMTASATVFTVSNGNLTATTSLTLTGGTATVAATTAAVAISGVTVVATSGQTITLTVPNTFTVGETVTIGGLTGGTNYNTSGTITAADPSAITVTYAANVALGSTTPALTTTANAVTITNTALPVAASGVSADSSKFGYLVEKGSAWAAGSTAFVGGADSSWGQAYTVAPIALNPNVDNHEIVTTSRVGYPDFAPTYIIPNVVGKTFTNAVQALKAAGLNGVTVVSTSSGGNPVIPSVALSASTAPTASGSTLTYTTASAHYLTAGDVVTIKGVTGSVNTGGTDNTQFNRNLVQVVSVPSSTTFTVSVVGVTETANANVGLVYPFNTVVTSMWKTADGTTTAATAGGTLTEGTDSKTIYLTHYNGL